MEGDNSPHDDFLSGESEIESEAASQEQSSLSSIASQVQSVGRRLLPGASDQGEPLLSTADLFKEIDDEVVAAIKTVPAEPARHYLAFEHPKSWTNETTKIYATNLRQYLRYLDQRLDVSLTKADQEHFEYFLRYLKQDGFRTSTILTKVSTIRGLYLHLQGFFDMEVNMNYYWLQQIEKKDIESRVEAFKREALDADELQQLVENSRTFRDRLVIRTLYQTAMRNSELRGLTTDRLHLAPDSPYIEVMDCKKNKLRPAPLTEELARDLQHWKDVSRDHYSIYSGESDYVFPSQRGDKLETGGAINNIVHNAAEETEFQDVIGEFADGRKKYKIDAHVLRHTGNTHWEQSGIPQEDRMLFIGHELESTHEIYTHSETAVEEMLSRYHQRFDPAI